VKKYCKNITDPVVHRKVLIDLWGVIQDVVTTTNILYHYKHCDMKVNPFGLKKGP